MHPKFRDPGGTGRCAPPPQALRMGYERVFRHIVVLVIDILSFQGILRYFIHGS